MNSKASISIRLSLFQETSDITWSSSEERFSKDFPSPAEDRVIDAGKDELKHALMNRY